MSSTHENVGHETEHNVHDVSSHAVARLDDLEEGVGVGRTTLQLDGESGEEKNLDGGTRGVPEGAGDTISVADTGRLQEGGSPGPGRDDGSTDETALDGSAGGGEHLRGLQLSVVLQ